MTAKDTVKRLTEDDADDPSTFVQNYRDAWERAGFNQVEVAPSAGHEYRKYVWREGIFSVEATQIGRNGSWEIYAFINNVPGDSEHKSQSAYARRDTKHEKKAIELASILRGELENSMAARLVRLGFTGWRNHWHKNSINVTLKPSKNGGYANIELKMDYLPNDAAIKALTTLTKVHGEFYPEA